VRAHCNGCLGDNQVERVPAITDHHPDAAQLIGQARVEPEHVAARDNACVASLQQIHGSGHRAQVYPFGRRAALNVGDVALERFLEELPRARAVAAREHPGMHHAAQRRAMGRSL
jgi:hypothetical protein